MPDAVGAELEFSTSHYGNSSTVTTCNICDLKGMKLFVVLVVTHTVSSGCAVGGYRFQCVGNSRMPVHLMCHSFLVVSPPLSGFNVSLSVFLPSLSP